MHRAPILLTPVLLLALGLAPFSTRLDAASRPGVRTEGAGELHLAVTGPSSALAGEIVAFALRVERRGGNPEPSPPRRFLLRAPVPAHTRFLPDASSPGWTRLAHAAGEECVYGALELPPGGSTELSFALAVDGVLPTDRIEILHAPRLSEIGGDLRLERLHRTRLFGDCDRDGTPDPDELDCDDDGVPDDCGDACLVELDCVAHERRERLGPLDTLTLPTRDHAPELAQGFLVVTATSDAGEDVAFDHLLGQVLVVDGVAGWVFGSNPLDHRALVAEGERTDLDGDGLRDLDGREYEAAAQELLIPHFFFQAPKRFRSRSRLVLVDLSGGAGFTTTVRLDVFGGGDLEAAPVTVRHRFRCWEERGLAALSPAFTREFARLTTGHAPSLQGSNLDSGWFLARGDGAVSPVRRLDEPAIAALLIESVGTSVAADLPFERGARAAHLLPEHPAGNGGIERPGASASVRRRRPASLLLFPVFDHREGVSTIVTLTNASSERGTSLRFDYRGRFGH